MKRFLEASSWAGLATVLQSLKLVLPEHAQVIDCLTYVAGGLAIALPEKGHAPAPVEAGK